MYMKISRYSQFIIVVSLTVAMILPLSSCSGDVTDATTPSDPSEWDYAKRWEKYLNQHFTKISEDFYWTDYDESDYYGTTQKSIAPGEFVEFSNLTESNITIRYGNEDEKIFNLSEITDNKINKVIEGPYPTLVYQRYVDVPLYFIDNDSTSLQFSGGLTISPGSHISYRGAIGNSLAIRKVLTQYDDVYLFSTSDETGAAAHLNWICDDYIFDRSALRCKKSPLLINWSNSSWQGELAAIFPNPADFLQFMLAMPVVKISDYGFIGDALPNYVSIERLIRLLFSGFKTRYGNSYRLFYFAFPNSTVADRDLSSYPNNLFSVHYGGVDIMRIFIEAQKLKEIKYINTPATYMTLANVLRSMLLEERFYFDLQYRLEYSQDDDDPEAMRALVLTVKDKESARHLMDYLIMPMLVENKQRIKDYIRQDAALSQHAETLCSAVDRLEEIYAATTDLTLGYRMLCYPTTKEVSPTIWFSPEFE